MLNLDILRKRLRDGFQPFALVTTDGRRFRVPHPEFVAVGRGVVIVLHPDDTSSILDALHLVSIEDLPRKKKNR
ncbi:MAG: hypothetical protein AB7O66_08025 [Limisphaerales bacterium]